MDKEARARRILAHPGNAPIYSPELFPVCPEQPIAGKTVFFLGSSVTEGAASLKKSFAEYLAQAEGIRPVKEAVSGTLLVDQSVGEGRDSYITRFHRADKSMQADLFLCQLSTNDATREKPLGEIAPDFDPASFDTQTVTGAIEYLIWAARKQWNCPVAFYTGTYYDSPRYLAMVERLLELQEKWSIYVIDLWHDPALLAVPPEDYALYMFDPIHPTQAGYSRWWLPKFQTALREILA